MPASNRQCILSLFLNKYSILTMYNNSNTVFQADLLSRNVRVKMITIYWNCKLRINIMNKRKINKEAGVQIIVEFCFE